MADNTITTSGGIRISLRRSDRARRMTLRVPRMGGDPVLSMPRRTPLSEARSFAEKQQAWLLRATARQSSPQHVSFNTTLPVEGQSLLVQPAAVKVVSVTSDALLVPQTKAAGPTVQAFLKHLALRRLRSACDRYTSVLGRNYTAIAIRDTRSRWGSCSVDGRLMFSWRLVMAPPAVLDYVAAHEVAHLAHMDHSPRFWKQVSALMPEYQTYRAWLRVNGAGLQIWKFRD